MNRQNLTFMSDLYPEETKGYSRSKGNSIPKPNEVIEQYEPQGNEGGRDDEMESPIHPMFNKPIKPFYDKNHSKYLGMNCRDIFLHIQHCPICSQFFSCNKSMFIIIIIVLIIVCGILLKRIMS